MENQKKSPTRAIPPLAKNETGIENTTVKNTQPVVFDLRQQPLEPIETQDAYHFEALEVALARVILRLAWVGFILSCVVAVIQLQTDPQLYSFLTNWFNSLFAR